MRHRLLLLQSNTKGFISFPLLLLCGMGDYTDDKSKGCRRIEGNIYATIRPNFADDNTDDKKLILILSEHNTDDNTDDKRKIALCGFAVLPTLSPTMEKLLYQYTLLVFYRRQTENERFISFCHFSIFAAMKTA